MTVEGPQGYSDLYPKDYAKFKDRCDQRLTMIEGDLRSLRTSMGQQEES